MKRISLLAVIAAAFLLIAPSASVQAQSSMDLGKVVASLTGSTGKTAGSALLGLYTQYKADGKFDLSNANNISNLIALANNIKGLKTATPKTDMSSFISGLISGSNNLVNKSNSGSVLESLTSISKLDLSSLGNAAISSVAKKAVSNAISKAANQSVSARNASIADDASAQKASSILTSLFSTLSPSLKTVKK